MAAKWFKSLDTNSNVHTSLIKLSYNDFSFSPSQMYFKPIIWQIKLTGEHEALSAVFDYMIHLEQLAPKKIKLIFNKFFYVQ